MASLKHELWEAPDDTEATFCLSGPMGDDARKLMALGSKLIWTVMASSHFDAMTKYHQYKKWEPYKTEHSWDREPYPDEWFKIQNG